MSRLTRLRLGLAALLVFFVVNAVVMVALAVQALGEHR